MKNNAKKIPPMREFYSCLNEIRDLYQNQGFLIAKDLFEEMKNKHNWMMSYKTFTIHFNKEFKSKTQNIVQINSQNIQAIKTDEKISDNANFVLDAKENEIDPKLLELGRKMSAAYKK